MHRSGSIPRKYSHIFFNVFQGGIKNKGTTRRLLFKEWASFKKMLKFQPLDAVRDYYGVKIALYFAWLGYYTTLLIPPAIAGLVVLLYGIASRATDIPRYTVRGYLWQFLFRFYISKLQGDQRRLEHILASVRLHIKVSPSSHLPSMQTFQNS